MASSSRVVWTASLLVACVASVLMAGCSSDGDADREPASEVGGLPAPVQLPPAAGVPPLSSDQMQLVVATASADPQVAAGLREGTVSAVRVRAAPAGVPGVGPSPAATVAFVFDTPVEPTSVPWPVLCDIAGQTRQWQGVAAQVDLGTLAVEGSPIWLTGANCVGWHDG